MEQGAAPSASVEAAPGIAGGVYPVERGVIYAVAGIIIGATALYLALRAWFGRRGPGRP